MVKDLIKKILSEEDFSGWVNVKIDKDVEHRVKRMMKALGFGTSTGNLRRKFEILSNPLDTIRGTSLSEVMGQKISAIILLQYLKELRDNFHASSSGFLFESFLAGMIPGDLVERNQPIDIEGHNGYDYQVKHYRWNAPVSKIANPNNLPMPDYYLVGYKQGNNLNVYQMKVDRFNELTEQEGVRGVSSDKLSAGVFRDNADLLGVLELGRIEEMSKQINQELMGVTTNLWEQVSQLHFNIETMLTGISEGGERTDLDSSANQAIQNSQSIEQLILSFMGGLNE